MGVNTAAVVVLLSLLMAVTVMGGGAPNKNCPAYRKCVTTKIITTVGTITPFPGVTITIGVGEKATCGYVKSPKPADCTVSLTGVSHFTFYSCKNEALVPSAIVCDHPAAYDCNSANTCSLTGTSQPSSNGVKCGEGTMAACVVTSIAENVLVAVKDGNGFIASAYTVAPDCACSGASGGTPVCLLGGDAGTCPTEITGTYSCPTCNADPKAADVFAIKVTATGGTVNLCTSTGADKLTCSASGGKVTISGALTGTYDITLTPAAGTYLAVTATTPTSLATADWGKGCGVTSDSSITIEGVGSGDDFTATYCSTVDVGVVVTCGGSVDVPTSDYTLAISTFAPANAALVGPGCLYLTDSSAKDAGFPGTYTGTITYKDSSKVCSIPACPGATDAAEGTCDQTDTWTSVFATSPTCGQPKPALSTFKLTSVEVTGAIKIDTCPTADQSATVVAKLTPVVRDGSGCEDAVPEPAVDNLPDAAWTGLDPRFDYKITIGGGSTVIKTVKPSLCGDSTCT